MQADPQACEAPQQTAPPPATQSHPLVRALARVERAFTATAREISRAVAADQVKT
jgi:hypothetical protein